MNDAQLQRRLAKNVKRARLKLDMTQDDVAAVGIIEKRQFQEIEEGRGNPTLRTLLGIALTLATSVAALCDADSDDSRDSDRILERRAKGKRNWAAIAAAQKRVAALIEHRKRRKKTKANKPRE